MLLIGLMLGLGAPAFAQVNINVNVGTPVYRQPIYTEVADYYYLPDLGVYYNVPRQVYVFQDRGQWIYARRLPARFGHHHDWRRTHFVRMHERAPFLRNDYYYRKYSRGAAKHYPKAKQYDRRHYDRHDKHYDRGHGKGHDKGRGRGHDKDHGRGHGHR